jgi:hypothetical protein
MGLSKGGLAKGGLAISFSRDSDRERRIREWERSKGASPHEKEHRRNRLTSYREGYEITGEIDSGECAAEVGDRGEQIIAAARATGATAVIVPALRRLGVGVGQVENRRKIEAAGIRVVSGNERENAILACEPSARREKELWGIAGDDEYEWRRNHERAQGNLRGTREWEITLAFIRERPHLTLDQLARILEARAFRTVSGRETWARTQVSRARREAAARNAPRVTAGSTRLSQKRGISGG